MEAVTNSRIWLNAIHTRKFRKAAIKFTLMLSILATNLTLILSVMAFTRYDEAPLNPSASYADMLPSAPTRAALEQGFSCLSNSDSSDGVIEVCDYSPSSDLFSRMRVATDDGLIKVLILTPHDNAVKLGDLILRWGTP